MWQYPWEVDVLTLFSPLRKRLLAALLTAVVATASGCGARSGGALQISLDGEPCRETIIAPEAGDGLRVHITLDGSEVLDLPYGEAHTVRLVQPDVGENTVVITEEGVYMGSADCDNQDCVNMGAVTRENLEMRVMGGFIVCLPHKISVEVRGS